MVLAPRPGDRLHLRGSAKPRPRHRPPHRPARGRVAASRPRRSLPSDHLRVGSTPGRGTHLRAGAWLVHSCGYRPVSRCCSLQPREGLEQRQLHGLLGMSPEVALRGARAPWHRSEGRQLPRGASGATLSREWLCMAQTTRSGRGGHGRCCRGVAGPISRQPAATAGPAGAPICPRPGVEGLAAGGAHAGIHGVSAPVMAGPSIAAKNRAASGFEGRRS